MKVKSIVNGFDLTEGKIYDIIFEYDSVYELQCDSGQYCRPKTFFIVVEDDSVEKKSIVDEIKEAMQSFDISLRNHFKSPLLYCKVYMNNLILFDVTDLIVTTSGESISVIIKIDKETMEPYLNLSMLNNPFINKIAFYDDKILLATKVFKEPEYLSSSKTLSISYQFSIDVSD